MDEGVLGIEGRDHKEEAEPDEVEMSEDGPVALSEVERNLLEEPSQDNVHVVRTRCPHCLEGEGRRTVRG